MKMEELKDIIDKNFAKKYVNIKDVDYDYLANLICNCDTFFKIKKEGNKREREYYYNIPVSFDIETTSCKYDTIDENGKKIENKMAYCYIWQVCIAGLCIYGRYLDDYVDFINIIEREILQGIKMIIYVHNLSYEFQFIRKYFYWDKVFATDMRKVLYAQSGDIVYKCSYFLTGMGLAKTAENLLIYNDLYKLTDLDYDLDRNSKTPLTDSEMDYCMNDVKIVVALIYEKMLDEEKNNILKIPLTKTGYVRRLMREKCFENKYYKDFIKALTLEPEEYILAKLAFAGGFTHSNHIKTGMTISNVYSDDFTSSYPAVMMSEFFPMSKGKKIKIKTFEELKKFMRENLHIIDITLKGLHEKENIPDNIISFSKCIEYENCKINNGRIISADKVRLVITDIDLVSITNFYDFSNYTINCAYQYNKRYLPKEIISTILSLYATKTELKDVEGKEKEYQSAKENVNSIYGMMVEDPIKDEVLFNQTLEESWTVEDKHNDLENENFKELLDNYNNNENRFTFYLWGVFITAYARRNLYMGILEFGDDYIYSDTDSIKSLNRERHTKFLEWYNKSITNKIGRCLNYYNIDTSLMKPKTIKGIEKPLGVWDYEGKYDKFKTLGAKRYMLQKDDKISITISGVPKKMGSVYIASLENPFEEFKDEMVFKGKDIGKMCHTYIDDIREYNLTDYMGNTDLSISRSGVHLEYTDYSLSLDDEYMRLLMDNPVYVKNYK